MLLLDHCFETELQIQQVMTKRGWTIVQVYVWRFD